MSPAIRHPISLLVVLMPQCQATAALELAEKLRLLIAPHPFPGVITVTASFGVAEWRTKDTLDDWLKRADAALFAAKTAGRNQVSKWSHNSHSGG
jgi:diguanylate cyclase (GGDEF)-like protein